MPFSVTEAWSEADSQTLQQRMWQLLERLIRQKTQGDSTSLRYEDAAELMESAMFTLQTHLTENNLPQSLLLTADMNALFRAAQSTLLQMVEASRALYGSALQAVETLGSRSLRDTLTGIGGFFSMYDARLYAHRIPADIDYQLCHPIPDSVAGVCYIREYLRRLLIENEMVTRFDRARAIALLRRVNPLYGELLVNLYEPIAADVVGLSLLGGGETLLEVLPAQATAIYERLNRLSPTVARAELRTAAAEGCARLGIAAPESLQYLGLTAEALYPRIMAAPQSAYGVFSVCG